MSPIDISESERKRSHIHFNLAIAFAVTIIAEIALFVEALRED